VQYYNPLCNFAFKYIQDIEQVEDIVQDVFLKFWNIKESLDDQNNIKSFLFTSTKNKALEQLRRNKTGAKVIQLAHLESKVNESTYGDSEEYEEIIKLDQIYAQIRHLPPKCKEVFMLAKINGLSYSQISKQLNISEKTVENHISKALKLLRNSLNKNNNQK